ncbi:MAG: amino acid ABC transporter substrate-binding protein [Arenibacterium sp.]
MLKLVFAVCTMTVFATGSFAQTLDRIKETGQLRLGFRIDAPPLSYLDTERRPSGYTPAVCSEVAQGLANGLQLDDLEVTFVPVTAENRFEKIVSGEVDLHCGAATITLRRMADVGFSIPVYVDGAAAMLPKGASQDMASLSGKKIGVRSGTTTEEALSNTLRLANIDAEVVSVEQHPQGVQMLLDGELQAYFADQSILLGLRSSLDSDGQLNVMDRLLTIEKQGLGMARGDADFKLAVDSILSDMYAAGIMQQIFAENMPGAQPGLALEALYLIAPVPE